MTDVALKMPEEWRDIPGLEGCYQASDLGRIQSLDRVVTATRNGRSYQIRRRGQVLSLRGRTAKGYRVVGIQGRTRYVHELVALTFLGPRPDGLHVCHNDDVKVDNRIGNLRYDTPTANSRDAIDNGRNPWANKTRCPQDHEYTPENTWYLHPARAYGRICRTCRMDRRREKRAAANAASAA